MIRCILLSFTGEDILKTSKLDKAPSNVKKARINNEKASDDSFQTMLEEISMSRSEVSKDVSE